MSVQDLGSILFSFCHFCHCLSGSSTSANFNTTCGPLIGHLNSSQLLASSQSFTAHIVQTACLSNHAATQIITDAHSISIIHIIIPIQVFPTHAVRVVVFVLLRAFMQMVQDPVHYPSDGPCIFADFFQGLHGSFFFFRCLFFRCHFKMVTRGDYLSFVVLEYRMLANIFYKICKATK